MKILFLTVLSMILPAVLFATAQQGDILIYKGDTLMLFANPLEDRNDMKVLRPRLFDKKEVGGNTGCWRGYIAEWIVIDQEIYLNNIYSCEYGRDHIKADLKSLFRSEYRSGRVKATWVSDSLVAPSGRLMHYIHDGYDSFYEKELLLVFKNGKLQSAQQFDNSKSHKADYPDWGVIVKAIYKNLDWARIPYIEKRFRVIVFVESGNKPVPENVVVAKSGLPSINAEIIRAVKMLGDWNVYYRLGQVYRMQSTILLRLDEATRKLYANQ